MSFAYVDHVTIQEVMAMVLKIWHKLFPFSTTCRLRVSKGLIIYLFSLCLIQAAQAIPPSMLTVIEENAGYVSFYNPKTGQHLGSIQVGFIPHEAAITQDGKTAYVSNFGIKDYDSGIGIPGASISVIDIPHRVEKYRLYTFGLDQEAPYPYIDSAPHGVKLRPPAEQQLYVNLEKGAKVLVYDLAAHAIVKKFSVSPYTHNIFFSPDGKILWLMAGKDGVQRMDPDTGKITGIYHSKTPVRGLKYTPDNRSLMVSAVNQITFIDPDTLVVQKQFNDLGVGPLLYADITPNQKYIVAPAAFDNEVLVIDVASGKVIKRLVTGLNPVTVLIDQAGQFAYISNATDEFVTKLNLTTFTTSRIHTHDGPNGLNFVAYAPLPQPKKLVLGATLPLTGADAQHGRDMMRGYEYWRLLVERSGGLFIHGQLYDLQIVYLDTQSRLDKVAALTGSLIKDDHVQLLLAPADQATFNLQAKLAEKNKIFVLPPVAKLPAWVPNNIVRGHDYFVTTNFYDDLFYRQYNFKASNYSAMATALGLALQKAITQTGNWQHDKLTAIFAEKHYHLFYRYH